MVEPEEARAALGEIRNRQDQVRSELAAHRTPWWATGVVLLGFYLVLAGLDFPFPVPLVSLPLGLAVLGAGVWLVTRLATASSVQEQRGVWSTLNVVLSALWVVAIFGTYALLRMLLKEVVPEGVTSLLAALPATVIYAFLCRWLLDNAYGRADQQERA